MRPPQRARDTPRWNFADGNPCTFSGILVPGNAIPCFLLHPISLYIWWIDATHPVLGRAYLIIDAFNDNAPS